MIIVDILLRILYSRKKRKIKEITDFRKFTTKRSE